MPLSPNAPKRVGKQQFMVEVLEDRASGMTWPAIAAKHGKSVRYIRDIAYEGMEVLQERKADLVAQIIQEQMERLQKTWMAFEDQIQEGDPKAAQIGLGVIDRIMDIKGLRAASKTVNVELAPKDVYDAARILGLLPPGTERIDALPLLENSHAGAEGDGLRGEAVDGVGGGGP